MVALPKPSVVILLRVIPCVTIRGLVEPDGEPIQSPHRDEAMAFSLQSTIRAVELQRTLLDDSSLAHIFT
jgi:hypothetical protein